MAETLVTLSMIGVLCTTTLAVNSMDANSCKVSETKAMQTNEALNAWSKNSLKGAETAVGIAYNFDNEEALIGSLSKYMNIRDIKNSEKDEVFMKIDGYKFKNYKKVTLSNGTFLNIKYIYNPTQAIKINNVELDSSRFKSYYAYISVNVPYKNKTRITGVYLLKYDALKDIGYIDPVCEN